MAKGKFVDMASKASWIAVALGAVMLFGCKGGSSEEVSMKGAPSKNSDAPKTGKDSGPSVTSELTTTVVKDTVVGTGAAAANGDTLFMKYTGKLKNGNIFDSTDKHGGTPFSFVLGTHSVITGWDKGLLGMKVGGKRTLSIPYTEAYGDEAKGADIPAKSDLYFDVELIDVQKKGDEKTIDIVSNKEGKGRAVKKGDTVAITYVGTLMDGTVFDASANHKEKVVEFKVGNGDIQVVGLDVAVIGMKVGGQRKVKLPPMLAYGPYGRPNPMGKGGVPANAIVFFDIKLVSIK